jgi:hypothetical protein
MGIARSYRVVFFVLLFTLTNFSSAEPVTPISAKVAVLNDVAQALGSLGDAIVKITDGVKHLIETSSEGVDVILAENTKSRLKDLSARSTQFSVKQNIVVTQSIDDYLIHPTPMGWHDVTNSLSEVLTNGKSLLDDWHEERSDFILEDAYATISATLSSRLNLLQKLVELPPPTTPDELTALSKINVQYKRLIEIFRNAIKELNAYLKHDFS